MDILKKLILDDVLLREEFRGKKRHSFEYRGKLYNQCYDPSTDVYNPYRICVYVKKDDKWDFSTAGSGSSIMDSLLNLINSTIEYKQQYRNERDQLINKVAQVNSILRPFDDDHDDRF